MADSVYGSAFYASTGLHGLITIVPIKKNKFKRFCLASQLVLKVGESKKKMFSSYTPLRSRERERYKLEYEFSEWLSGFTDAEGNFNISLRKLNNNSYTSVMLTFQISLHINDLLVLKLIKDKLKCGLISISGSKCNYFVNDKNSLIEVIVPLFNYIRLRPKLNSSKFHHFILFEKAVNLIKNKKHLSAEGKIEMINL